MHLRSDGNKIHPNYFYSDIMIRHVWIGFWKISILTHLLMDQLLCIWFFLIVLSLQLWICIMQSLIQRWDLISTFFIQVFIFLLTHLMYPETSNCQNWHCFPSLIICLINLIENEFLQLSLFILAVKLWV